MRGREGRKRVMRFSSPRASFLFWGEILFSFLCSALLFFPFLSSYLFCSSLLFSFLLFSFLLFSTSHCDTVGAHCDAGSAHCDADGAHCDADGAHCDAKRLKSVFRQKKGSLNGLVQRSFTVFNRPAGSVSASPQSAGAYNLTMVRALPRRRSSTRAKAPIDRSHKAPCY